MTISIVILYHSGSGNTKAFAKRIANILHEFIPDKIKSIMMNAEEMDLDVLKQASAYIIGTPDYFGYPAGKIKTFFDEIYPDRESIKNRPVLTFVSHGGGGKAAKHLDKLVNSMKLQLVSECFSIEEQKISAKMEVNIQKSLLKLLKMIK